ncbi:hypothetical protein ACFYPC_09015 [Streptomyces sp. NPDC005808]|uniref:hypothetical protein n=1 Tax=Streptomyces sp. NPDC005808 TaxID=3364734 RepID=UPI0036844FD5
MTLSPLARTAAGVIRAQWSQGRIAALADQAAEALESAQLLMSPDVAAELEQLRAQVAELEAQRDRRRGRLVALQNDALNMRGALSPNGEDRKVPMPLGESLTPAVEWLISRVAELEEAAVEGRAALASLCYDHDDPGSAALGALYLLQQATFGTPMEPGEAVPKVYRASHDSIVMGLYTTAAAAREHCEAEERRSWLTGTNLAFDWIEDEEDGIAELVVVAGQNEESITGYVVDALDIAFEYDEEADE